MLKKEKKTKHKKLKLIRFVIPIDISTTFLLIICVGKGETGIETVSADLWARHSFQMLHIYLPYIQTWSVRMISMIIHKDLESLGIGSLPASRERKRRECLVLFVIMFVVYAQCIGN